MPAQGEIFDQAVVLPRYQVIVAFLTVAFVLFAATLDQTCIATAMPKIAEELDAGNSITWVGTAFLVASTTTQVISSRLSDIFGRKSALIVSVIIFGAGNLFSGFATNAPWLYAGRGIAGLGAGGINSLSLIVISDVVSLRDRGMYVSLMGIPVALGLGLGPEIGGAFAEHASWRWSMWVSVPISVVCLPVIYWLLPLKAVPGSMKDKLRSVDWGGCVLSLVGIVLLLIPVSAGGSSWAWDSPESIAMFVIGGAITIAFVVVEYFHPLPILPLWLFTNRTVCLVLLALLCVGVLWHANQFIAPLYLQNVVGYSPVMAGAILLPLLVGQVFVMTALGYMMKKTGKVKNLILIGYIIWTAGQGMQIAWGEQKNLGLYIGTFIVQGVGFGLTSQSTLVLAQASCKSTDRAVITGARNLFRTSGGAVGLAISNAIINGVFNANIPGDLPPDVDAALRANGFSRPAGLTAEQTEGIVHAYYLGLRDVFIMYTPIAFACFVFCLGTKDVTLDDSRGPKPKRTTEDVAMEGTAADANSDRASANGAAKSRKDRDGSGSGTEGEDDGEAEPSDGDARDEATPAGASGDADTPEPILAGKAASTNESGARIKLPRSRASEETTASASDRYLTRKSSRRRMSRPGEAGTPERDEL